MSKENRDSWSYVMHLVQAMLSDLDGGGVQTNFVRLLLAFQNKGIKQTAVIMSGKSKRTIKLREVGIDVKHIRFLYRDDPIAKYRFSNTIRREQPDIVISWLAKTAKLCPEGSYYHLGRVEDSVKPYQFRKCSHLICHTRQQVQQASDLGWPEKNVHYICNFSDFQPSEKLPRENFSTPYEVPLLLALGRFVPAKAFDVLISALTHLPDAYLWMAGDGELDKQLKRQAADLGVGSRVRFLGWRDDVATLLASADVLVVPSRHEPLGNVILESWSSGTPVVAAASNGPSELISHGETGLLVPVDNPKALALCISKIISDRRLRNIIIENSTKKYNKEFSTDVIVDQYFSLFEKFLCKSVK